MTTTATPRLPIEAVRREFPVLDESINGRPLVYFDNAATSQKPRVVIDALVRYYEHQNSNVHRGVHALSQRATDAYEGARETVRNFLNAQHTREIVFVRGATEGINLVAFGIGQSLAPGDEILITHMEHHSNIVPWQLVCERTGAKLRVAAVTDDGAVDMDDFAAKLNERTKFVSVVHISNALGTINPVERMIELAHAQNTPILLDGAQAAPHTAVDVQKLDCDYYVFSGHKVFGPTGIGVLYGKTQALEALPPYQSGGDMIRSVTFEKTLYNDLPYRFEAGTPNIADAIGLGAALDYVRSLGFDAIAAHEARLTDQLVDCLAQFDRIRLIGTARPKAAVQSFVIEGVHPHDVGTILDTAGVAIRAGHHCTQPLMQRYGVPATARASLALYNHEEELTQLEDGIRKVLEVFG